MLNPVGWGKVEKPRSPGIPLRSVVQYLDGEDAVRGLGRRRALSEEYDGILFLIYPSKPHPERDAVQLAGICDLDLSGQMAVDS